MSELTTAFIHILVFFKYNFSVLKLEEKKGLKNRASSDTDLLKEQNMVAAAAKDLFLERELLPFRKRDLVREFVANLSENYNEITQLSDGAKGTWSSALSECEAEKGESYDYFLPNDNA